MQFNNDLPIYRQIGDYCRRCITSGEWSAGSRIPSTKDLCEQLAVNNRTVLKAFDELADEGVIFQRRGMGYYVAEDARSRILDLERREFMNTTLPQMVETMKRLGISRADIEPFIGNL